MKTYPFPMLPTTLFSTFGQPSPSWNLPVTSNLHSHCPFCSSVSLVDCVITPHDNVDLHISSLGTLVPEGTRCVFSATRHQVYWGLTQCGFLLVLGFDITHKTYTGHSGASRLTHPYKFILKSPVMCSQQLPLLHWMMRKWKKQTYTHQTLKKKDNTGKG